MRFLFITKEYPPIPDPSGRIVYNLVKQLCSKGHCVDVIARSDKFYIENKDSETIYWVKYTNWEKLCKKVKNEGCTLADRIKYFSLSYLRKIFLMFNISKFPDSEPAITKKTVQLYDKYLSSNNYHYIISFFRPYSCLSAGMKIIDKCKNTKMISVYFDLVEKKDCPSMMPQKLYDKLIIDGDIKVFEKSKSVMLPLSAKKIKNEVFDRYKDKITYYEFPTFVISDDNKPVINPEENEDTIKFVFAGTLNKNFRNPSKMMNLLKFVSKISKYKIKLDIFGGGDCTDLLNSFKCDDKFMFKYHGKVSKAEVTKYEKEAHILLNIMNNYNSIVPSKIFELFASGKPIINIMTNCDDGSLEYFKKYPLCYTAVCDENKDVNIDLENINTFISKNYNSHIDVNQIKEIYKSSTPEYMSEQILKICNDQI